MNILVLGATGLLGHTVFRRLSNTDGLKVLGTIRNDAARRLFGQGSDDRLMTVRDLGSLPELTALIERTRPDVVVNCVAVGRPVPADPMVSIAMHALLPQRLALLCKAAGCRLVHISSDGVFTGAKGSYTEDDIPDAADLYGVSKLLGEVSEPHAVTLRTSILGHELQGRSALLEWFLSQDKECRCYTRAIFTGFPTVVLADILRDHVIPQQGLRGVYHVASSPISKFDLLELVARRYGKDIRLVPDDSVVIDRSLIAERFAKATGYVAPDWPVLVDYMYRDRIAAAGV